MKPVKIEELQKGDLILVRWMDASEMRAHINQHNRPEVYVKDWGVFLGVSGQKRRHVIIGKDVVETWNEWGAARIPLARQLWHTVRLIYRKRTNSGQISFDMFCRSLQNIFETCICRSQIISLYLPCLMLM